MTSPEKDRSDQRSQLDKFKDAARELECDDDEQRFRERLGKLVRKPSETVDKSKGPSR